MRAIVWFRRDLRVYDQPALAAAMRECDEVVPLFIFDDPLLSSRQFGSANVAFMLSCLEHLVESLQRLKLTFIWRRGDPVEELARAARELRAEVVYWNRDYEPAAIERDRRAVYGLAQLGVATKTFKDHVVFEARDVLSSQGKPIQRYGAYRRRWREHWQASPPRLTPRPTPAFTVRIRTPRALPTLSDLGYDPPSVPWKGGETAARRRLRRFLDDAVRDYATDRNRPAVDGTSRLSPYFRFGALSTRTAIHAALATQRLKGPAWQSGVNAWIDELIWRDFFQQILANFSEVTTRAFHASPRPAPRHNNRLYRAWCRGLTGFPLIDAGMRQLNRIGWMHNRVRMVVASFLVKDLRLDWRSGEQYFLQHLVDGDTAANNGNWQWCASTGTDAMPGFRIFSPARQSQRFDSAGDYIRQYVPELAHVPPTLIHRPELMTGEEQFRFSCRIGHDYPTPIVDHETARRAYVGR
jgi:deoxyribodipyrimidine photo-lyase